MAKKRIHINESQLYGLVEQVLNELDWRTKAQLANARDLQASNALLHATTLELSPEEKKYWDKVWPERDLSWLNASAAVNKDVGKDTYGYNPGKSFFGDPTGRFYKRGEKWSAPTYGGYDNDYYSDYGFDEDFMKQVGPYLRQESYYDNTLKRWLDPDDEGYDKDKNAEFWRQEKLKRPNKDDDERYKRVMRSGQKNESIARRVTESVMRKLRRGGAVSHSLLKESNPTERDAFLSNAKAKLVGKYLNVDSLAPDGWDHYQKMRICDIVPDPECDFQYFFVDENGVKWDYYDGFIADFINNGEFIIKNDDREFISADRVYPTVREYILYMDKGRWRALLKKFPVWDKASAGERPTAHPL